MSELGNKLRGVRESKGLSLQEVGLALKISPRIIAAIEVGEKSGQPAKTFLRGFVKSYAQYLKLDYLPLLELFDSEYSMEPLANKNLRLEPEDFEAQAPQTQAQKSTPDLSNKGSTPTQFPSFPWGKTILIAFLFVMIVILAKVVHKYQKEKSLPDEVIVGQPVETVLPAEPAVPVLDPSVTPVATNPDGSIAIAGTLGTAAAGEAETQGTPKPEPKPSPSPTPAVTASPTPSPTPTPSPSASPTPKPTPTPTPTPVPAAQISTGEKFEVLIEAGKSVAVTLDLGGGKVSSLEMNRGDVQVIRSRSPILIEAGDGSALTVFVNGRAKAKSAQGPLKLRIPE